MRLLQKHLKITIGVALIVIVLAVANLLRRDRVPAEIVSATTTYFEDLKWQAATIAADLPGGARVVVLVPEYESELPSCQSLYQRIYDAIEDGGVEISQVEKLTWDAAEVSEDDPTMTFPYRAFLRVARDHPDAAAIISLCGAPYFSRQAGPLSDPTTLPPLFVTRKKTLTPVLENLLARGWIAKLAVLQEGSDSEYRVVTSPRW